MQLHTDWKDEMVNNFVKPL